MISYSLCSEHDNCFKYFFKNEKQITQMRNWTTQNFYIISKIGSLTFFNRITQINPDCYRFESSESEAYREVCSSRDARLNSWLFYNRQHFFDGTTFIAIIYRNDSPGRNSMLTHSKLLQYFKLYFRILIVFLDKNSFDVIIFYLLNKRSSF